MPSASAPLQKNTITIRKLESITTLKAAFKVMAELRPHLDMEKFLSLVHEMREEGYRLAGLFDGEGLKAVAGYRIQTMLVRGRSLYVDDLVTTSEMRGKGYGKLMLDWLMREAKRAGCNEFHLDSGVQRFAAHAFYFGRGLHISGYHFVTGLK
jgi:GNAT superfamily N-acetyltransferase